ncbi:hypothetical protein AB0O31_02580 [Kitasatospora cineracea]|uniref:hypothetical protein n=1 Tax=Kitasatospora cineracea TaxID=88074 RepID=UPI0034238646
MSDRDRPTAGAPGGPAAHLEAVPRAAADRRRSLYRRLAELGWERMSPAFALTDGGAPADYRGVRVPPGAAFSTHRTGTSSYGARAFTLRTLDLDFGLVGRNRLRRAGVNQRLYSLGHALQGERLLPDVLLAEGWIRGRDFDPEPTLRVLEAHFGRTEQRIEWIDSSLVRFRLASWEARGAH